MRRGGTLMSGECLDFLFNPDFWHIRFHMRQCCNVSKCIFFTTILQIKKNSLMYCYIKASLTEERKGGQSKTKGRKKE